MNGSRLDAPDDEASALDIAVSIGERPSEDASRCLALWSRALEAGT